MVSVTFIYRFSNNPKVYYGKYYCSYISDDHNGLDIEILPDVLFGINEFRKQQNLSPLKPKQINIGIMSCSPNDNYLDYSTRREIKAFDFYLSDFRKSGKQIYINGSKVYSCAKV